MASIRTLKKDIDYLVGAVAADSFLMAYFHPERQDKITEVIEAAVKMRSELFNKVNARVDEKDLKKHFKNIRAEMMGGVDALFDQLSKSCEK